MNLFHAAKCSNPVDLTSAIAVDYVDPALEGQIITFACSPGQILSGPSTSTCMGNAEWEPDPREVECTGTPVTTGATLVTATIGTCIIHACQVMILWYIQCFEFNART
jgi:hypothetical protein